MTEPTVSVVIPSYRQPQFLERSVTSVLEQDFTDVEVIVVDDCSGDQSLGIALALATRDARVRVVARQVNGGLGRARNTGLVAARAKWVTFLDSDDYLLPGALSSRMDVLARQDEWGRTDVVGAYGDWMHVPERVDHPPSIRAARPSLPVLDSTSYRGDNAIICSSPIVLRSALLAVGGFGEDLPMLEDFVAWARLLAAGGALLPTQHVVCVYRQRPMSMLRGQGLVLPSSVRAINDWWAESGCPPLTATSRLRGWLEDADPKRFDRIHWVCAAAEPTGTPKTDPGPPSDTPAYHRMQGQLDRTAAALEDALNDTVEAQRHNQLSQLVAEPASEPDLVLVPTDVEGALECAALAPELGRRGRRVHIGLVRAEDLALLPARFLPEVTTRLVGSTPANALHVVFANNDEVVKRLVPSLGRAQVGMRPTGTEPFRVYRRGAALRFRSAERLFLRSRLEIAELGDRPSTLVPSGARFGLDDSSPVPDQPVLCFPASVAAFPALEGLVTSLSGGLAAEGYQPLLVGAPAVSRRLPALRFDAIRPELLRGTVVLPDCQEVALVRALGGRPVVVTPGSTHDLTPRWATLHALHQTVEDVLEQLVSTPPAAPEALTRLADDDQDLEAWVTAFASALDLIPAPSRPEVRQG